mmetsp:Transcript_1081/g.2380  ORF Transcript_1081/g.2380 Transcript_1081/m.2380 type:complete len:545 (-) Transcript_1081:1308-2942(-)|eukprot:CAMPEP_0113508248 /NCGR_PEP_ID=MMETSP0014_2-20120614/36911_1 /TAXON_ID=2857 /ORGANISM="Nitzschia sp." /LENGTH=544 /DNA_ID=CAMNT_0000403939 /DNA_START=177 /DNA_END=1811 /DNA_ORIENTATION=- /assembly_acc=CAM_ASM_000159
MIRTNSTTNDDNDVSMVSSSEDGSTAGDDATSSTARMMNSHTKLELTAEVRKLRRELRKKERLAGKGATSTTTAAGTRQTKQLTNSTVWVILVIGLVFCLCDVLYIIHRLDSKEKSSRAAADGVVTKSSLRISSTDNTDNNNVASSATGKKQTKNKKKNNDPNSAEYQPWIQSNHKPKLTKKKDGGGGGDVAGGQDGGAENVIQHQQLTPAQTKEMLDAKSEVVRLINAAGIPFDPFNDEDDLDLLVELPYWSNITSMYGPEPTIYGLDEGYCQQFQTQSDPGDHLIGVAGTFNSGTNLLAELLIGNCHMPERQKKYGYKNVGIRWQVPWGKHTPPGDPDYREQHKTKKDADVDANNIMPMVTIRDPLIWLQSMCRHHYTARWINPDPSHCPDFTDPSRSFVTNVKYADFSRRHDSIVHHFNDYYNEYIHESKIPFLLVRFEDLVFHPEETTKTVCECAGGAMKRNGQFHYVVDSAKKGLAAHGKVRTGYVDALIKYSTIPKRYKGYDEEADLEYIRDSLDPELMNALKYPWPDPKKAGISKGL